MAPSIAAYVDFTVAKGVHLTRFLNYNVHGTAAAANQPPTRDTTTYTGANPFEPQLGDVFVTNSRGRGLYRGLTVGVRRRFAQKYQFEANYVLSKDEDDDSNERDPFTDRSFNFYDLSLDYGPRTAISGTGELLHLCRAAEAVPDQRPRAGANRAADHDVAARAERRRSRPQLGSEGQRVLLARLAPAASVPVRRALRGDSELEMFNTFNNANNVNPLSTPAALRLRRLPAPGRRRSAAGAAGGEGDVLNTGR